jgi:hypothetical protein
MFSLPVRTLVLSTCFPLHNFCVNKGESSLSAILRGEEQSVSEAVFWEVVSRVIKRLERIRYLTISRGGGETSKVTIFARV